MRRRHVPARDGGALPGSGFPRGRTTAGAGPETLPARREEKPPERQGAPSSQPLYRGGAAASRIAAPAAPPLPRSLAESEAPSAEALPNGIPPGRVELTRTGWRISLQDGPRRLLRMGRRSRGGISRLRATRMAGRRVLLPEN